MPQAAVLLSIVLLFMTAVLPARAADPTTVRVNVFPGVQNLAIFAGQAKGFFAKHGTTVEMQTTPNSPAQRAGLAEGKFEIAHAGLDNAVAMVELAKVDAVIVMGGDNSMQELFAQPGIASLTDLKGKTVIVDAPNTAYALIVKKALLNQKLVAGQDYTLKPTGGTFQRLGLMKQDKEHAATMLNPPFSVMAVRDGFKSLGLATKLVGPYQGTGAFVLRSWAKANGDTLERYIRGYVEATRWSMAPANRAEAAALLTDRLKLAPDIAAATLEQAVRDGFAPDARLDLDGFRGTLAVRAATENTWKGPAPAPDKYVDLSYYQHAVAALK